MGDGGWSFCIWCHHTTSRRTIFHLTTCHRTIRQRFKRRRTTSRPPHDTTSHVTAAHITAPNVTVSRVTAPHDTPPHITTAHVTTAEIRNTPISASQWHMETNQFNKNWLVYSACKDEKCIWNFKFDILNLKEMKKLPSAMTLHHIFFVLFLTVWWR